MIRLGLAAAGAYDAYYLVVWLLRGGSPRFGDFAAFWSFGRFALTQPLAGLYDPVVLQAFQKSLDPAFTAAYPFVYPPSFLLVAGPLALAPQAVAWLGWTLVSIGGYVAVAGRGWPAVLLLVAPTTLVCVVAGQAGLLMAALLLGGMLAVRERPWLGGALLGLLTLKPQLAVLAPVALVASGQWRALAAAGFVAGAIVALSAAVFGWAIWLVWLDALPSMARLILQNRGDVAQIMPTVSAGLFQLGVPDRAARLLQLCAAAGAAYATWRACRIGITPASIAVLALATFLATPYAYIYDLPMVPGGLVLLLRERTPSVTEALVAVMIMTVPLAMLRLALPLAEPVLLGAAIIMLRPRRVTAQPPC